VRLGTGLRARPQHASRHTSSRDHREHAHEHEPTHTERIVRHRTTPCNVKPSASPTADLHRQTSAGGVVPLGRADDRFHRLAAFQPRVPWRRRSGRRAPASRDCVARNALVTPNGVRRSRSPTRVRPVEPRFGVSDDRACVGNAGSWRAGSSALGSATCKLPAVTAPRIRSALLRSRDSASERLAAMPDKSTSGSGVGA
jgi:hypothetical protein